MESVLLGTPRNAYFLCITLPLPTRDEPEHWLWIFFILPRNFRTSFCSNSFSVSSYLRLEWAFSIVELMVALIYITRTWAYVTALGGLHTRFVFLKISIWYWNTACKSRGARGEVTVKTFGCVNSTTVMRIQSMTRCWRWPCPVLRLEAVAPPNIYL
jgi:hypothetical protein